MKSRFIARHEQCRRCELLANLLMLARCKGQRVSFSSREDGIAFLAGRWHRGEPTLNALDHFATAFCHLLGPSIQNSGFPSELAPAPLPLVESHAT